MGHSRVQEELDADRAVERGSTKRELWLLLEQTALGPRAALVREEEGALRPSTAMGLGWRGLGSPSGDQQRPG